MMVPEQLHPTQNAGPRLRAPGWLAWVGVSAAAAALGARLLRRVRVSGDSMRPAFRPEDRLVILPARRIRPGDIVAITDPRSPGRLLVKRVHAVDRDGIDVRGDNEQASTDSRQLGPIPRSHLAGQVIYRYAPAGRTGWFPGRDRPVSSARSGRRGAGRGPAGAPSRAE